MFANINTIDVNHLDMDRKKDARPILTVQSCVSEVLLQEILLNWKYMKWIIFWITDKNIKVYTIDSHIVIRSWKYDSLFQFMSFPLSCNYINCLDIDKKKKTGAEGVRSSVAGLEYLSELKWNESFWTTDKDICTRSSHVRYPNNPRLKYHSLHYFNSCHFHHRLRTHDGLLSSWRD